MKKFYEKNELWFAIAWIVLYCMVMAPIRGSCGDDSPVMLAGLTLFAAGLLAFIRSARLEKKYGLVKWRGSAREYLYFLPILVLTAGNLWGGVGMAYEGRAQLFAVLSMFLVGIVEELIFRGLLFRALLEENAPPVAITISAATFGIGHIVNLLTGRGGLETFVQVLFAIAWGFLFTLVFYHSGSLLVCIFVHGMVDVFSKFTAGDRSGCAYAYVIVTILVSIAYCLYLSRKPAALAPEKAGK